MTTSAAGRRSRTACAGGLYLSGLLNALFGSAPLGILEWALSATLAVLLFATVELEK